MISALKKMDAGQRLCLLLIIALIVNAVIHACWPAYRYYKKQIAVLDLKYNAKYADFCSNVQTNILPLIKMLSTNIVNNSVSLNLPSNSPSNFADIVDSDLSPSPILPLVDKIDYNYAIVSGDIVAILSDNYPLRIGDNYPRGGIVYDITPDCIILSGGYRVGNGKTTKNGANKNDYTRIDN